MAKKLIIHNHLLIFRKGYTLIEILVVITILGIIFGFGFVNFREFSRRQALAGSVKGLIGDLRLTQELALAGKKPEDNECQSPNVLNGYNFKVQAGSGSYSILALCSGSAGEGVEIKNVLLPADISISNPTINPVLFKALGQGTNISQGQQVTINLTQAGTANQTTLTITSSGEIK